MSGKSPRWSRIVMRSLSRAIHGIPRAYLHNRRGRLIFPLTAGTFLCANGFFGQAGTVTRPRSANGWSAVACVEDSMADEDVEDTPDLPDLSISPEKVCFIIVKAR